MKKPELLVTPTDVAAVEPLVKAGADAILIGEQRYGLRLAGEFTKQDVQKATVIAQELGAKVYVAMNAIFHNEKVDMLAEYVRFLRDTGIDGIVFGDPAVLMTVREVAPNMKLHWNTETTATNWYTANYWGRKGAKRAVLAREISMDAIVEIKEHAEVEIEVQVHGMTAMFQSKRKLVGNYMEFQGKNLEVENRDKKRNMFLYDPEREAKYPIFEDENGTHIMSPNDICIIDELEDMIDAGIDSFKIDGILKTTEYMEKVTSLYRQAIDLCADDREAYEEKKEDFIEEIEAIQPVNRSIDTGFFFKETVY
ncbi:U32 family peptidase [Halalkalibacterium halodurans]|jgi:putative protease|uniref:Protease n=2 Tax=Halalkalibacterium halodurans TaxID=86665 RepID=Q9KDE0_HALH5|nr:peptidase U32 family protein [Halalkalibacterium halodurans]MDY7221799.1 peptidase U32 family protein [Halalkalibacterium halodurans]MDY7241075.1 peptidase U32 family protein [Halalkalibacterium halodurans]MED3648479.1 U32 family peptidase [Halalkalibacterium halodurans]MED4081876.1 U32 family peptidase [Halalkalibacterium halodurans]MED4086002.1 U32 family peptidase [Halalkalibacterium halodurans]